jgi:hypothetical protein
MTARLAAPTDQRTLALAVHSNRILCPLCGRAAAVSYVLTDDVAPPRPYRRRFVRVPGGWAHPVRHLQELASGRLSRRYCGLAETGRRAP